MLFNAIANKGNECFIKIGEDICFSESKKFSIKLSWGSSVNRSDMEGIFFSTGTAFQIAVIGKCSERFWSITV